MRESIGGAWFIGLIITFMMVFVGYLTVMINYSNSFKIKNEVVHIIEKYEGLTERNGGSVQIINQYLANTGYNSRGKCPCSSEDNNACYGASNIFDNHHNLENVQKDKTYYYCVQFEKSGKSEDETGYYDIQLFLKFDLPVLGQLGNFTIKGQTIKIKHPVNYGGAHPGKE